MPNHDTITSTLTARYQTTVPAPIRKSLGLEKRDQIEYRILDSGEVILRRAPKEGKDPALAPFLALLEQDIIDHPEDLRPLGGRRIQRAQELTEGMHVDLDTPLDDDDE